MNDIHHTDIVHTGHWSHHVKNRTLTTPDNDHTRHPPTTLDIHLIRYWPHQTFTTRHSPGLFWCGGCLVWWMSGVVNVLFLHTVWWLSGMVNVWCGGCLVWSMSYFTHGVVIVQCGQCLCGQCYEKLCTKAFGQEFNTLQNQYLVLLPLSSTVTWN